MNDLGAIDELSESTDAERAAANRARVGVPAGQVRRFVDSSFPVTCQSCGKQTIVDSLGDTCLFCGEPVRKKEEKSVVTEERTYVQSEESPLPPVPARPVIDPGASLRDRLGATSAYYDANRAAIVAEWEQMGKPNKLERWGIGYDLRGLLQRWGIVPKPEKWGCTGCESSYEADGQRFCSSKTCHSRRKVADRLPFRTRANSAAAAEIHALPGTVIAMEKSGPKTRIIPDKSTDHAGGLPRSLVSCTRLKIFGLAIYEREVTTCPLAMAAKELAR